MKILRRIAVANLVCGSFFFWVAPMHSVMDVLRNAAIIVPAATVLGLFLAWPRERAVRIVIFAVLGLFFATLEFFRSHEVLTTIIAVMPLAGLLGTIMAADAAVAWVGRKIGRDQATA